MRHLRLVLLLYSVLLFSGCGSSVSTTLPQQWSTTVPVQDGTTANVSPEGDHVFLVHEKDVMAIEGRSGEKAWGEKEGIFDKAFSLSNLSVNGTQLGTSAPEYQQLYVDYADLVLLFDYSASDDVIRAIAPSTGEEKWMRDDFQWSLGKYNSLFAQKIGGRIAQAISSETGGQTQVDALDQRFVQDLALTLPDRDVFIFRTVDALIRMDLNTGDVLWEIPEFDGMGIGSYMELPGGDVLVVSKAGESVVSAFSGQNHVARLDPDTGDLRWVTTYGTGPGSTLAGQSGQAQGLYVRGNTVILDTFGRFQAYDLESGEMLWHHNRRQPSAVRPLVTDEAMYTTTDAGKAVQVGVSVSLTRYDLRTGDVGWKTDAANTTFVNMISSGDRIVASATGDLFDGAGGIVAFDASTGDEVWRSEPFAKTGTLSSATQATNLIVDGATVFAAGPESFRALDMESGSPRFRLSQDSTGVGRLDALLDHGSRIVAVGERGAAFIEKEGGTLIGTVSTHDDVRGHVVAGDRLVLEHKQSATVVDLAAARKVGVGAFELPAEVYGDLGYGIHVTRSGQHLFLLNGTTLSKHQL